MAQAKEGDKVKVNYTGSLEDGTVFGSSSAQDPLEFTIGQRNVLPSFENAVIGMNEGDTKTVSIHPEDAFGHRKEDLIFDVARTKLPANIDLKVGGVLRVGSDEGQDYDVIIANIDDEVVTLDGNHPLAGQVLNLEIQLIKIL
ncbi:MAG: FKBP-type peptidyl-prolyl cis-trans isomerase [Deltaproteobacteria bacterium]|nr:FKBP-type peptidyl-prolyl cis-trans isomerase [Deltaproteobacteria bacterium]